MLKHFIKHFKLLLLVSIIVFCIHLLLVKYVFNAYQFFYPIYAIYIFLVVITALVMVTLSVVNQNFKTKVGFAFLAFSILKMLFAVVFLLPLITSDLTNKLPDFFSFFIPYFIYLAFETVFVLNLLKEEL